MKVSIGVDGSFMVTEQTGFGTVIRSEHGQISVLTNSPYSPAKHSITSFEVNVRDRGNGYGKQLLKEAIRRFGSDLGGQASSKESIKMMYDMGFRMANKPEGTLAEAERARQEDSSVYMRLKR